MKGMRARCATATITNTALAPERRSSPTSSPKSSTKKKKDKKDKKSKKKKDKSKDPRVNAVEEKTDNLCEKAAETEQKLEDAQKSEGMWQPKPDHSVRPMQKIGLEFVDQDKLEKKRKAQERARKLREEAQAEIDAWRSSFRSNFSSRKGAKNKITPSYKC